MYNVLIFPSGSEIGLEINNALKYSKNINVFGGTSISDHSDFVYKNLIHGIPYYFETDFLEKLNQIISDYDINFIYPALDSVQMYLTEHKKEINATIITSDLATVEICRSKEKTYEYFSKYDFIPKTYKDRESIPQFPIFVKPAVGCGSNGAELIHSSRELEAYASTNNNDGLIFSEYLPGEEYTIDCFTDNAGKLLVVKPRIRERIKCGISVNSHNVSLDENIINIAETINAELDFKGAWFFQIKKDVDNKYKLLEISPRIPGTMGVSRNCGINFPLLTLYIFLDTDVEIIDNKYNICVDRAFISRYSIDVDYNYIYVDLDDTIILNNTVNAYLMMFLYQSVNSGKKIILLSKHELNIANTLKKNHISENLFSEIIQIKKSENKGDYIMHTDSIFIDDSFSERLAVWKKHHIPVFDLDMIECLVDWKKL